MADEQQALEVPANDIVDLDVPEQVAEPEVENETKAEEKPEVDEEKPKRPSGSQRAKWREQQLLNELSARDRELESLRRAPAAKAGDDDKPPREEDFNGDFFKYQQAATAHEAGKAARAAIRSEFETREQSELSARQNQIARERQAAHIERVEDAREVIADFDSVMSTMKGKEVRNDVIDEVMSSDKSALISYHLAQNPEKLDALNAMSPRELAREMGRLEATVNLPTAKKQTSAPPPLSAVKGGASPASAESDLNAWLKKTYG